MTDSGMKLKIMPELATTKNLIDMLSKSLSILHISCHGVDLNKKKRPQTKA